METNGEGLASTALQDEERKRMQSQKLVAILTCTPIYNAKTKLLGPN